jgi:hypothetical protein
MFFEVDGKLYDAQFSYEVRRRTLDPVKGYRIVTDPEPVSKTLTNCDTTQIFRDNQQYVITTCAISLVSSPNRGKDRFKRIATGQSVQGPYDRFNKKFGRQLAFGRALKTAFNDVENGKTSVDTKRRRAIAWNQYFRQVNSKQFGQVNSKVGRRSRVSADAARAR